MSLLNNEFAHQLDETDGLIGETTRGFDPVTSDGAPAPPQRFNPGPRLTPTSCETCLSMILCYSEWQLYSRIPVDISSERGIQLARRGFAIHWGGMLSYLLNCAIFIVVLAAGDSPNGPKLGSVYSIIWSFLYLLCGCYGGWYFCTRNLFVNLSREDPSTVNWMWFNSGLLVFLLFSTYLFCGFNSSGAGGLLFLLQLTRGHPINVAALALSALFVVLQVLLVCSGIWLYRAVKDYCSSFPSPPKSFDV